MLLEYKFSNSELNQTLKLFLQIISGFFKEQLFSVVLHGGVVFDDLAPGYGDLDFIAVTKENLSDDICQKLIELRKPFCNGKYGTLSKMLEGAFLPREMLNPKNEGKALWWGTTGEREWESNQLGWLVLQVIREHGIVIFGEDVRNEIPEITHESLIEDVWSACKISKEHIKDKSLHSIDWLLTAARLLLWLKENRFSSKSEAADWGYLNAKGGWRKFLPRAKQIRLNPIIRKSSNTEQWLVKIEQPIKEAFKEVEHELIRQGYHKNE